MSEAVTKLDTHDPVWRDIRQAAITLTAEEPVLGSLVHASVLNQPHFEDALAYILAQRLGTEEAPAMLLRQTFDALSRPSRISGPRPGPTLRRCTIATPRASRHSKHCCSSRGFMPFKRTAWHTPS